MYKIWVSILCFTMGSLSAEMIGDVEYSLPKEDNGWKVANEMKNEGSATLIYVPEGKTTETAGEFFGVNYNLLPFGGTNEESLKKIMQEQFPDAKVSIKIIEADPKSVLYEWSLSDQTKEVVHGWSRAFASGDGTAVLMYTTEHMDQIDHARKIWEKMLREAKIIQKEQVK